MLGHMYQQNVFISFIYCIKKFFFQVWVLRLCINILNHDGNLLTCCSIAALAALAHFKTPLVTFDEDDVIVHSLSEKLPVPLSLHHYPVVITYAFYENGYVFSL